MTKPKEDREIPISLLTGHHLDGKEVALEKKRGRPFKIRNPLFYPLEKKTEAAALYAVIGHVKTVADRTGVPEEVIQRWRLEPWWADILRKILIEGNDGLLSKINSTIETALVMLEERMLNGDVVYCQEKIGKDGNLISEEKFVRVPVKARDLTQIFAAMTKQRSDMTNNSIQMTATAQSTAERLATLGEQFIKFSTSALIEGEVKVVS